MLKVLLGRGRPVGFIGFAARCESDYWSVPAFMNATPAMMSTMPIMDQT